MAENKLELLGANAVYDLSCACGFDPHRTRGLDGKWIYPTAMPDGSRKRTLKVLLDNACSNDCTYCAQRASRDTKRDRFAPEELARLFDQLLRARMVEALFLSSGIGNGTTRTMDKMIATIEIIRRKYGYKGFVHLKVLPGAELSQIERALQLAQRVSINLEAPTQKKLANLSKKKDMQSDILQRMWWIAKLLEDPRSFAKGQTTQFVVGASNETDREIVFASSSLYKTYKMNRIYYSAFQPVSDTPLENRPATPFMREHRLYQVDFLLRKYGFSEDEIPFKEQGNLSLEQDPKTIWAHNHPEHFPVEVNRADKEELLRVPGLGPVSVGRIIKMRKASKFRDLDEIHGLGARIKEAATFLTINGKSAKRQLDLFTRPAIMI